MENKHFSHIHNLSPHQMPEGREICCSGCKFQGSGMIYACWECNFFLHEQCFKASRSMQHPSHPAHPLSLFLYPTYPSNSIFCDSCELVGSGFSYSCSLCEFDLHVHCAYNSRNNPPQNTIIPNQNPNLHPPNYNPQTSLPNFNPQPGATSNNNQTKTGEIKHFSHDHALHLCEVRENAITLCSGCDKVISGSAYQCKEFPCTFNLHQSCFNLLPNLRHKAHPNHRLTLIFSSHSGITCDACRKKCLGLTYSCSACNYYLHVFCASKPEVMKHWAHRHPLSLYYNYNGASFLCDICLRDNPASSWVYYCRQCHYGTHSHCGCREPEGEVVYEFFKQ